MKKGRAQASGTPIPPALPAPATRLKFNVLHRGKEKAWRDANLLIGFRAGSMRLAFEISWAFR
jgi:hypothetical protein